MVKGIWFSTAALVLLSVSTEAFAQRGFSRRQQASLYAYQTQLQAQNQARYQRQFNQLGTQLQTQQQALQLQQFRDAALIDYLNTINGENQTVTPSPIRAFSGSRAAQAFGTVHYVSPYYLRLQPYYDYGFVRSRNRVISPAAVIGP